MIIEILVSLFLIIGTFVVFTASIGLLRLPDVYCRMQATSKASTLGLISILIASIIYFNTAHPDTRAFAIEELLILAFTFISAPVAAHMMARSAYILKTKMFEETTLDELKGKHLEEIKFPNSGNHEEVI
ncbi:MAG: monovalent cation/H(+) antiporter subunit G [Methanosarcinaceae archaeon]